MANAIQLQATNAQILDAIRNESGNEYQQRIPASTQGDISRAVAELQTYRPLMNQFVDALMNRIGSVVIQNRIWDNPLAQFKRGMLNYGDTIEETYTNLLKAQRFDPNTSHEDVFKKSKPDVKSAFHTIGRQDQYPVTIEDKMLRRAFLDETGLQTMVGTILQAPYNSDYYDEYLIMRNLLTEFAKNQQFYKVQIPNILTSTNLEKDMKFAVREMKSYANRFKFMSANYNPAGVTTFTPESDLVVFINTEFDAALDVEVLAAAFNMDKAEYLGRRVLVDDFGVDGCMAILADKNLFMCADTLIDFTSIYNPKALGWNYFLNHHGIYSLSRFMNAVMFTIETGSTVNMPDIALSGVTLDYAEVGGVKPEFAPLGESTRFEAVVAGTVTPATEGVIVPQSVVWSLSASDAPTAMGTFIDPEGVLHVDEHEQATNVSITVTTTYVDPSSPLSGQSAYTDTLVVGIGSEYVPD